MRQASFKIGLFIVIGGLMVIVLLVGLLIGAEVYGPYYDPSYRRETIRLYGGEEGFTTLNHPTKVVAYRVDTSDLPVASSNQNSPSDFPISSGPVQVPSHMVKDLSLALTTPRDYFLDSFKACAPEYGGRLTFIRGKDLLDVFLCFRCNMMLVFHNNERVRGGNMDRAAPELSATFKTVFPDQPLPD